MDTNNWRPTPSQGPVGGRGGAEEPTMDNGNWRAQLQPDSRQRIVNKIMDTLKRHLPFNGQDGFHELKKIAMRFEEMIYSDATSQGDYLGKISLKMLTMETESQNPPANSLSSNPSGISNKAPDTASLDSTAQTGHATGGDWQEEIYQKIKAMKEMYLPELNEMYHKIAMKLQQHDSLPQQPKSDPLEKLKMVKNMLERIISFLQISKSNVSPAHKDKLGPYEKQILNFINTNRPRKPVSSLAARTASPTASALHAATRVSDSSNAVS